MRQLWADHAGKADGSQYHPLMMKRPKSELKARPSHPLRGPRLALHSQPAAAARRMRREFPPRPLSGRLLINSLRSAITRRSERCFTITLARQRQHQRAEGAERSGDEEHGEVGGMDGVLGENLIDVHGTASW
jgi:hypothetical protein